MSSSVPPVQCLPTVSSVQPVHNLSTASSVPPVQCSSAVSSVPPVQCSATVSSVPPVQCSATVSSVPPVQCSVTVSSVPPVQCSPALLLMSAFPSVSFIPSVSLALKLLDTPTSLPSMPQQLTDLSESTSAPNNLEDCRGRLLEVDRETTFRPTMQYTV